MIGPRRPPGTRVAVGTADPRSGLLKPTDRPVECSPSGPARSSRQPLEHHCGSAAPGIRPRPPGTAREAIGKGMNAMLLEPSARAGELGKRLAAFMDEHVYPNEAAYYRQIAAGDRWQPVAIVEELKARARAEGLWN